MKIVVPPMTVAEDDGFNNDVLNRKPFGEALLNIVTRTKDELVISIDGQWGEGKTTFVKMWRGLLAENNIPSIYIDAFANDYADDAFIVIASAITEFVEKNISKDNCKKVAELKEETKRVGIQLLSWSARVGIKVATLNIIKDADIKELGAIKDEIAKGVSGWVGDFIEEPLKTHAEGRHIIQSFRDLLSSIPAKLEGTEGKQLEREDDAIMAGYIPEELEGTEGKQLVVILDELDRCKPTFAVDAVEKIKHLFSVQNVVFVLVMNKVQLEQSVRIVYGQELDAHTYLQKFINLETRIPKKSSGTFLSDASIYIHRLIELHEFEIQGDINSISRNIGLLAVHLNLSLRQLEKVFTILAIFYGFIPEDPFIPVKLYVLLAVVKVVDPLLFEKCLMGRTSYKEVSKRFGVLSQKFDSEQRGEIDELIDWIRFTFSTNQEFDELPENHRARKLNSERMFGVNRKQFLLTVSQRLSYFVI